MARDGSATHAGGIVYRQTERGPEYLIVRSRSNPSAWVLPKGHIEAGETPEACAVREVQEESGCAATIVAPLGRMVFGNIRTRIYLMRFKDEAESDEGRELFWGSAEDAGKRLSFKDTRALLARAHARVTATDGHD